MRPQHALRRCGAGILIGMLAASVVLTAAGAPAVGPFLNTVELKTYDWRLRRTVRPETARRDLILIEIDEHTLRRLEPLLGRWPWPRVVHAHALDFISRGRPRAIVYDVLFTERDRRGSFPYGDETMTGEDSDRALVDATARAGNVVHLADVTFGGLRDTNDARPAERTVHEAPPADFVDERPVLATPFEDLARASATIAHNLLPFDDDGPARRVVPFVRSDGRVVATPGVAAVMTGDRSRAPRFRPDGVEIGSRFLPTRFVPVPRIKDDAVVQPFSRRALINFRGPALLPDGRSRPYTTVSFYDVFYAEQQLLAEEKPLLDPGMFKDGYVFVGVTAAGLFDVFVSPFGSTGMMPGIQVHAAVADDLLSTRFLLPASERVRYTAIFGTALGAALAATLLPPAVGTLAALLIAAGFVGGAVNWLAGGTWVGIAEPILGVTLSAFMGMGYQYAVEGREKRQIKRLFGRYVSKDVFNQLMANPSLAVLGGRRRHMTVLFSDIRGFTAASERSDPEQVVAQLNEYFSRMVQVVLSHNGTVDKFVGDMVMALFGAPLEDERHADHAVETALEMIRVLEALNDKWAAEGLPRVDIGIGINSGDMIAGNVGSETLMSYTVIGDAVNLGSRLESLNKEYGTRIIISDATRQELHTPYDVRPLGAALVKGRTAPVEIFEVRGRADVVQVTV